MLKWFQQISYMYYLEFVDSSCVRVAKSMAGYETVSQISHAHPRYGTYRYIDQ